MSSTSETGHAVNLDNFRRLLTGLQALGATYAPTNPALSLASLQALQTDIEAITADVRQKKIASSSVVSINNTPWRPIAM